MQTQRLKTVFLIIACFAFVTAIGWATISQNTISHNKGAALPSFNATDCRLMFVLFEYV